MKLALVNIMGKEADPPLGLAYIASYIREYSGFKNTIILDRGDIIKKLKKEKPDLVGFSSITYLFPSINQLAKKVKQILDIPVIVGGQHISSLPIHLASSVFDLGVIGEGEQTMLELIQLFEKNGNFPINELRKIKGIVFRNERKKNEITEERQLIEPLDKIPFPARDLLDMGYYLTPRRGSFKELGIYTAMLTSRGCPYKCAFCSPTLFWEKFRAFSAKYVFEEMKMLVEKYKIEGILIWDDLFIADKKRLKLISDMMEKEKLNEKIRLSIFGRANLIDEEMCKILKKMNVTAIDFGLESGSEKILKYLKKGTVTVKDNYRALKICKEYGMKTIGTLIMGSPDETEEDLKSTLNLINNRNLDEPHIFQLMPLPGTEVWEYAKNIDVVSDDPSFDFSKLQMKTFNSNLILTKHISKENLIKWYSIILENVNKKGYEININKTKYLKYLFTNKKLLLKILSNWREYLHYLNNIMTKNK